MMLKFLCVFGFMLFWFQCALFAWGLAFSTNNPIKKILQCNIEKLYLKCLFRPKRAVNTYGKWKVIVNLPDEYYARGTKYFF